MKVSRSSSIINVFVVFRLQLQVRGCDNKQPAAMGAGPGLCRDEQRSCCVSSRRTVRQAGETVFTDMDA